MAEHLDRVYRRRAVREAEEIADTMDYWAAVRAKERKLLPPRSKPRFVPRWDNDTPEAQFEDYHTRDGAGAVPWKD